MSHSSRKRAAMRRHGRRRDEAGVTVMEVLVALSIMALILATIHLTVGNAISAKLMVSNRIADQNQGRLAVEWIADRARQAGLGANPASAIARCRNGIVSQDPLYYPTTNSLSVTADVTNTGTAQTRTFKIETVSGMPAITESVTACSAGATTSDQPITDTTSVKVLSLTFAYFDVNGNAVTNLANQAAIQSIRQVKVTVQLRALAGKAGPTDETWTTVIALRNP